MARIAIAVVLTVITGILIWQTPTILQDCPARYWAGRYCYTPRWLQLIAAIAVPGATAAVCTYLATTLARAHEEADGIFRRGSQSGPLTPRTQVIPN